MSEKNYALLIEAISEVMFSTDPVHINFVTNTGEYHEEAKAITHRLRDCKDLKDVRVTIDVVFSYWFFPTWGPHKKAKKQKLLRKMSVKVWKKWTLFKETNKDWQDILWHGRTNRDND